MFWPGWRRTAALAALFLLAACNDDGSGASDGTSDTSSGQGTSGADGSGGTGSDGGTGTGTGTGGTETTTESGSSTNTGTGAPDTPGSARIVYLAAADINDPHDAFYVEVTEGVASPPIKVSADLGADDWNLNFQYAPSGDAMTYRFLRADDTELHFVDLRTQPFTQVRINVAPAPVPGGVGSGDFSPGEDHLLFVAGEIPFQGWTLYHVGLTDGQPGLPVAINIPLEEGGSAGGGHYSPDATRLAYSARVNDQSSTNVYLGTPDPADAGIAVQVSDLTRPDTSLFRRGFTGDGTAFLYTADRDEAEVDQLFAVDISSDPPGPPIMVNDPPGALELVNVLLEPGGNRVIYWVGDLDTRVGDLYLSDVSGGTPTPPVRISTLGNPDETVQPDLGWSPDGRWFHYYGLHNGPDREAYLVDLSGPIPGPPIRVNNDLADSATQVFSMTFSPDSARMYYFADEQVQGNGLYMVDLAGGGVPAPGFRVSEELEYILGEVVFGPDPEVLLYTGNDTGAGDDKHLYMVDVSAGAPYESAILSDPNDDISVYFSPEFSLDGRLVFYHGLGPEYGLSRLFMVDLTGDSPRPQTVISDEVGHMWFHVLGRPGW